jgi:hypothetical protein
MVRILKLQMYFYHATAENRRNKIKTRTQFKRNFEQGNQIAITASYMLLQKIEETRLRQGHNSKKNLNKGIRLQ